METNKELQVAEALTRQLSICKIQELSDIVKLCEIADNFFKLSETHLFFIVSELKKDFSEFTLEEFKEVIYLGIKGYFDAENKKQQNINFRTIYGWFNSYLQEQSLNSRRIIKQTLKERKQNKSWTI